MSTGLVKYRGRRILTVMAIAAVAVQGMVVFFQIRGTWLVVAQCVFFLVCAVGVSGLVIHYREMWRGLGRARDQE